MSLDDVQRPVPLLLRRVLRGSLAPVLAWRGLTVDGAERLPTRPEPLIVACNHAAYADSVYLAAAIRAPFVVCGAKPRLFRTRARRALLRVGNVLRVDDRDGYLADGAALLRDGATLVTYPELGRNPDGLGRFATWTAELALATGVELLPVYLHGTTRGHAGPVRVVVGHRMAAVGTPEALTERLRDAIVALGAR